MNYEQLSAEVRHFVSLYFKTHEDGRFTYHNKKHTCDVADAVTQIASHYQLNDEDLFVVTTAAWFHDTGYTNGSDTVDHEEKSALMAIDCLNGLQVDDSVTDKVRDCIMATKMPQNPQNQLQNIICDADLFHLGQPDFWDKSKQLRKELETLYDKKFDKKDWRAKTIELMEHHQYHTDYCRLLLNSQKEKNLEELKNKQAEAEESGSKMQEPQPETYHLLPEPVGDKNGQNKKKDKNNDTKKGIETMFRISSNNHQRLSNMADSKAHIMISVNSIVISVLLTLLLRRLDEHPRQTIPAILLLTVNLVTIVFSILATRPTISQGTFTQQDIDEKKVNLLFFGNFFKMTLDQYNGGMVKMMNDKDFLYGSLIRDLYSQGVVLGRKYRLLRISYNVFMFGLIFAVLAFIISSII